MPTNPADPQRSARPDQPQTSGPDAWFQGSRVRLDLNAEAAVQLRDALDRIVRSEPSRGAALARSDVRLPDGRPLRLSVRLTDTGTIRGPDGMYRSSEGVAYVDVSGDFDTHVAAREVIDAATRPYLEVPGSEEAAVELDAARVDRALDGRVPAAGVLDDQARDAVRARAQRAADQTPQPADHRRRPPQPGSRDRVGPMIALCALAAVAGEASRAPIPSLLDGPLASASQSDARVWSGRRLTAPRWTWRSSFRGAGAGGC